jgi:hypothetical protein
VPKSKVVSYLLGWCSGSLALLLSQQIHPPLRTLTALSWDNTEGHRWSGRRWWPSNRFSALRIGNVRWFAHEETLASTCGRAPLFIVWHCLIWGRNHIWRVVPPIVARNQAFHKRNNQPLIRFWICDIVYYLFISEYVTPLIIYSFLNMWLTFLMFLCDHFSTKINFPVAYAVYIKSEVLKNLTSIKLLPM